MRPGIGWRPEIVTLPGGGLGDGTALADDGDGLVDLVAVFGAEAVEVFLDAADEPPHPGGLLVRGHGLGLGPGVGLGHGGQPFPVAEQVVEVCLEFGQAGDVGAEVVAAHAAEADGAVVAAGLHVAGLVAGAEGDRDLADRAAGVFGVQQCLGLLPGAVAVAVELHGGDLVHRAAAALFADP
ncbi:hypothetical protein ABT168_02485 [Streptomyces sp. NPDC001793]|uniref:hypothetical protein n=1 Tax=Streptomyces sp. NPDC001793 TaxID=3154657 RepID=UPI00332D084C